MGLGSYQELTIIALEAEQDLSASQYKIVELNTTTGQVDLTDTLGELAIGILQNDPSSGQAASVAIAGVTKCKAGETLTRGLLITPDASGTAINASSGTVKIVGIALTAAASGETFDMLIRHYTNIS